LDVDLVDLPRGRVVGEMAEQIAAVVHPGESKSRAA